MSCADLAKERINILDIKYLRNDEYVVIFEYCYINKDNSKVWAKDYGIINCRSFVDVTTDGLLNKNLLEQVRQARAELEK